MTALSSVFRVSEASQNMKAVYYASGTTSVPMTLKGDAFSWGPAEV